MSVSRTNLLTQGFHGKIGNQLVLRYFGGRSVMSNVADYSKRKWSILQRSNRMKFREAVCWAKNRLKDEKILRHYRKRAKGGQNAYNVAIADYLKNLRIREVDATGFTGHRGEAIRVMLRKKFGAASVRLHIIGLGGEVLETGTAACTGDGLTWAYIVRTVNPGPKLSMRVELGRGPVSITESFRLPTGFQ